MDLGITGEQTDEGLPTHQATRRRALWWGTAVLLAGIIAIVLPIQKIRLLGAQLGGTIGSYTTTPPPAPRYAAISPGGSSITVYWSQVSAATSYSVYRSDLKDSLGHTYAIASGSSTSSGNYTDISTTAGKSYTYWVTASNGGAESGGSPSVSATINTPTPPAPAHGKLIVSGASMKAYFSTVSGASSYNAYRDGWLMQTGVTSPYTDGGVPVGTSHWYTFGAVNSNGQGSMGPYYLSATGGATPPVTTNLAATAGASSVQLSWNAVTDATGGSISYNLYRSSSAGGEGDIPVQNWISSNNSGPMSYTDNDVSPDTTYYYKVAPVSNLSGGGEGTLSNEASATPLTPLLPAPKLSGAPGDSSAVLTRTTVAGASSYNVYRSNEYAPLSASDNGKVPLVKVGASGTTYTDSGLTNGKWYYYSVNAVSSDGQGLSSQYVTVIPGSGSPTLAAHIVWTSDYTVTPNVQTGSTSGTVGGNTSVHLSLQVPPNFTSGTANVTIHEDAGDIPDVITTNVAFTPANYSNNYSGWSAVCGDPDPTKSGSPSMAYCDVPWSNTGTHNGKYTITVTVQATIGSSFTPVSVTSTVHVDLENLLITSTTPSDPTVTYNPPPAGGPVIAQAPNAGMGTAASSSPPGGSNASITFDVSVIAAYKSLQPVTLTIYDLSQQPIKTMAAQASAGGVVIEGDASQPTKVTFSWDGSLDTPSTVASPGIYSFQFRVGNACRTNGSGYVGYSAVPPTYGGSISDGDTDKSTLLSVTQTSIAVTDYNESSDSNTIQGTCILTDTAATPAPANQCYILSFDPNLMPIAGQQAEGTTTNSPGSVTPIVNTTTFPMTIGLPGYYTHAFCAQDKHPTQDKGHRNRLALPRGNVQLHPLADNYDEVINEIGEDRTGRFWQKMAGYAARANGAATAGAVLKSLPLDRIVFFTGHGSDGGGQIVCSDEIICAMGWPKSGVNMTETKDLHYVKLAVWATCHSAESDPTFGCIMDEACKLGATCSVGWNGLTFYTAGDTSDVRRKWATYFWQALMKGKDSDGTPVDVQTALAYATEQVKILYRTDFNLGNYAHSGNASIKLVPVQ